MRAAFQRKETRGIRKKERENCVFYVEYVCGIERGGGEKDVRVRKNIREEDRETATSRPVR